ncbi:nucleotidyltransferase family protein [Pseudoleptotrichia goodfellowii]|uniref:tRNA(Met) cytidine acetate ligase n=1 Tax=Pseudoleptotrichia goodfellowii F0264 TaxID=596323 RepID=D0GMU0_9FUSO|nr:nucleotidyltransferase family protein [Pseudoleptotrichia goodfellowii]EEY34577.1 cytidyltransferase-related domain protein [Pseudoleptotrichia goodfellowii F0264]
MRIGIVAEYNPFHNGHLYQIKKIKEIFGRDIFLVVIISGDFVQRGELSFLNKWEKTEIALENGVDLVVELPLYCSVQNAEIFSRTATEILDYLEVDMQVFGAEEENIQKLEEVIKLQSKQSYKKKLTDFIKSGNSYSTSQKLVLNEYGYENIVKSNNILGLEYIRAIKKRKLKIKPYAIKREVSQYNEEKIEKNRIDNMVSASFIRKEIEENNFEKIKRFVPENTYEILKEKVKERKEKGINDAILKNDIFKMVKYKFLTYSKKEIIKIYDTTEEIYVRIYDRLKESSSYNEFVKNVKSRNFSTKRIERIIMNIFLNVTLKSADFKVDYVRVLGFNSKGREYLKNMKDKFGNQKKIFVNWKDIEKDEKISRKKINIEKNGFLVKELLFEEKERLNPVVIE